MSSFPPSSAAPSLSNFCKLAVDLRRSDKTELLSTEAFRKLISDAPNESFRFGDSGRLSVSSGYDSTPSSVTTLVGGGSSYSSARDATLGRGEYLVLSM